MKNGRHQRGEQRAEQKEKKEEEEGEGEVGILRISQFAVSQRVKRTGRFQYGNHERVQSMLLHREKKTKKREGPRWMW